MVQFLGHRHRGLHNLVPIKAEYGNRLFRIRVQWWIRWKGDLRHRLLETKNPFHRSDLSRTRFLSCQGSSCFFALFAFLYVSDPWSLGHSAVFGLFASLYLIKSFTFMSPYNPSSTFLFCNPSSLCTLDLFVGDVFVRCFSCAWLRASLMHFAVILRSPFLPSRPVAPQICH